MIQTVNCPCNFVFDLTLFSIFSVQLVEEYASRWQVPLPQLRILEIALCYFARASTFFTSNCDHVLHTLSSLALSVFELLLFFDQKDFYQEPLKHFTVTFQECHLALVRHQNVHLLQVDHLVQGGGPWASSVLQAILSESSLPQNEVDGCISSELPVFFELRVRYLLSCERVSEAMALAKCCARHPTAGQHLFFLQVYLTWLYKTSQHDRLHKEVGDINGKDAVHIICSLECEEEDELLLALSRAFLSQQLCRGDMYYLCDLVFIWSKLHSRLNTSKQTLLEESRQLMLSATNVNSIFPFIRAILQELGEDGIQFCVELCANALESCLPCDVVTKSLIYKTIAGLLPNDLEVCRACALLVFFLERTVEAYKMVYLLYMHPDQEYHVEYSPIGNHVRFETLQVLKKDLYFDPEFWNLIALRTNCLKLMSEKVVSAALEEIMEDKWITNYCTKEPALRSSTSSCQKGKGTQDISPETTENSEPPPETEESKLEYCCTFCSKVFKGSRVVEHAMFHYRKDECMFCGTMFKDDLLAMMHLSDHIEKLKRSKESAGNKTQENRVSETKDISTPKTSAKAKTTDMSSGRRSSPRPKKSAVCPKSVSLQDSSPSKARKLRSNDKTVDCQFLQQKKLNTSNNGSKNYELPENQDIEMEFGCSTDNNMKETESLHVLKAATKQDGKAAEEKFVEPQEKVCCPVDGCAWFTDLSKNRVALLYHALEDHYGEIRPLELAFHIGNSRCSICMRVLWSFEHFQHHVERHRITPRHPCPHQGCTARFKTGMEMRRHARRHSPLQAVCCLPGCSQLFICLWALNLHEREHYASKPIKPDKITNEPTGDKHSNDKSPAQLVSPPKAVEISIVSNRLAEEESKQDQDLVKTTETSVEESKSKKSLNKQIKKSNVKQKGVSRDTSTAVRKASAETTQATISSSGYSLTMNGQAAREDAKSAVCKETLAEYSKKPYMRLPPTAYLDEKYITMPKRRKEMSLFQAPHRNPPPGQACVTAALQRQRCANCFATFNSAEDLQIHLQLQKCSNLFGFDSDDEGESDALIIELEV
uniref:C2H2-type domain-containing protein n=1 Tax=Lates calcarifer TaxID=8187 RepID=A0A4W6F7J2_LATCA